MQKWQKLNDEFHSNLVYGSFLLLATLIVLLPVVYLIIIPSKIHQFASGGRGLKIHSVELHSLDADRLDATLSATLWLKAAAPRPFSILPNAIFNLVLDTPAPEGTTRDEDLRQAGIPLTGFPFDVPLTAEKGDESIPFVTRTQFGDLHARIIAGLINDIIVLGKKLPPQTILIHGKPYVKPNTFWTLPGGFQIDVRKHFTLKLGDKIGSKDQYHVEIVDKKFTPVVDSFESEEDDTSSSHGHNSNSDDIVMRALNRMMEGKSVNRHSIITPFIPHQYSIFLNISFDNPHALTIHPQGFGLTYSVYYDSNPIVDVILPPSSFQLQPKQRNHNIIVNGLTVKEHFEELMDLVSRYSDGEPLNLVARDFKLVYEEGRTSIPWVEDMIGKWSFPIKVPAREVDNDEF